MSEQPKRSYMKALAIAGIGGALAVLWLFPCAIIVAATVGMTVPFGGFAPAGWEAVTYAPITVFLIGVAGGGFPITFGVGPCAPKESGGPL